MLLFCWGWICCEGRFYTQAVDHECILQIRFVVLGHCSCIGQLWLQKAFQGFIMGGGRLWLQAQRKMGLDEFLLDFIFG